METNNTNVLTKAEGNKVPKLRGLVLAVAAVSAAYIGGSQYLKAGSPLFGAYDCCGNATCGDLSPTKACGGNSDCTAPNSTCCTKDSTRRCYQN